jgi:ABC-type Mn2+/Zn2+ transport system ATPase subunit
VIERRVHPSGEKVLEVEGVAIEVGGRQLLRDVSFHVLRGEFMCLLGPNGAGKSTLLKSFLGFLTPSAGHVRVLGQSPEEARPRIGYVPQLKSFDRTFPATTIELIVANLRGAWPVRIKPEERDRAMAVLRRVKAERLAKKPLAGLSGGETQRVFLARALATDPELLLLDEPAAGVDAMGRADLYDLLHEISGDDYLAAVMVTHSITAISRTAEKIAFVDGTLRAFGFPADLFGDAKLLTMLGGHEPDDGSMIAGRLRG